MPTDAVPWTDGDKTGKTVMRREVTSSCSSEDRRIRNE